MAAQPKGALVSGAAAGDFDVFCHMLFEEFLMRKGLQGTLAVFRQEWARPNEDHTMVSWYETALKLRLPELVQQGSAEVTVLENLVIALLREASIKSRRAPDVLVAGLATLPRPRSLPALATDATRSQSQSHSQSQSVSLMDDRDLGRRVGGAISPPAGSVRSGSRKEGGSLGTASKNSLVQTQAQSPTAAAVTKKLSKKLGGATLGQSTVHLSEESALIIRRQLEDMASERAMQMRTKGFVKPSAENWIPEITRMRSLERDLNVAKDNLADIQVREAMENNEMKQFRVSELDKAIKAESLGKMHRQACGCCLLVFLPINLPLKVSQKAVLDIRIKWSGGLDSETVFGQPSSKQVEDAPASPGGAEAPEGSSKAQAYLEKMAERLSVVPRCYDEVPVCTFCAQFFHDSEQYRPSYDKIYYDERKAAHMKAREKERLYWDPLLLVERDREVKEILSQSVALSVDGPGSSSVVA